MVKKIFFLVMILLFISCILSCLSQKAGAADFHKPMTPIIDNSVVPELHLEYCRGYEDDSNWKNKHYSVPEKVKKEFKSKKWTRVEEFWRSKNYCDLTIYRWYFDYPEDTILFAESIPKLIGSSFSFEGWSKTPDIGDKTSWWAYDIVVFTKGEVLVKVELNAGTTMSEKQQKAYVRSIAEYIAKKL